ncbi:MAG: SusC/RagA family TonB-linked outer membrane protein, partial [Bacteroidetes bacterium]
MSVAQKATISGTVTDPNGDPLPGANVLVVEMTIGSATDIDGRYSFEVPAELVRGQTVTLRAGFVGYTPQERRITLSPGTHTEDFVLSPDLLKLDEVVVTGVTGATPQKKLAFTVSKLDASAVELAPATSPVGSMQGKIAGAAVLKNSGQPGSGYSVRLRGSTSITGSSEPLFIVDGVILGADQVDLG